VRADVQAVDPEVLYTLAAKLRGQPYLVRAVTSADRYDLGERFRVCLAETGDCLYVKAF
jgi:hypothetical protein